MGVILYELFVGQPPFYTNSIYTLIHLIVKDPVKYAVLGSLRSVAIALEHVLDPSRWLFFLFCMTHVSGFLPTLSRNSKTF